MVGNRPSTPMSRSCPPLCSRQWLIQAVLACASTLACAYITSAAAAAATGTSVTVDPSTGRDSPACCCSEAQPCKTIAYAVNNMGASFVSLSAGTFTESTVSISSISSLVISGVPSATVFDCSHRLPTSGAAFFIVNSTVTITGVTFQSCSNPTSNGGAVSASGSSVAVSQCSFINCSAASGGAMSVTGPGAGLFLSVNNSTFIRNSANGGLSGCPSDAAQPCATWGGAIAAFEMLNVNISGCSMIENSAQASVPLTSPQYIASRNTVAGGGCVSVLFSGNSSGSGVHVSGSSFLRCSVAVAVGNNVDVGNGIGCPCVVVSYSFWPCFYFAQDTAVLYRSTLACQPDCNCWTSRFSTSRCKTMSSSVAL
jgi:hypothetical protein